MFTYEWNLKDLENVPKNGLTVFSCFAGGGGSSQGYKMAGYDVIGCNEIDPRQMEIYKHNLNPKYSYLEDIRTFRDRDDLPSELFELDILDGSFPCTPFSTSNNSNKDISHLKKFREGQIEQTLDDLALQTIKLIGKLKPKVAILENVSGLMQPQYAKYVSEIYIELEKAGYAITHRLLNMSLMGIPQRRKRVFFLAVRKDLKINFADLFESEPKIHLDFNEANIPYREIEDLNIDFGTCTANKIRKSTGNETEVYKWYKLTNKGTYFSDAVVRSGKKRSFMDYYKTDPNKVLPTITAHTGGGSAYNHNTFRTLTRDELCKASSFPMDYDFLEENPKYVVGMSVPPLAMYKIAKEIEKQWLTP